MFLPMSCMQCGNAPCLEVCPTTATFRREDGIVDIDYKLCIGCGYCVVACPYLARTIMFHDSVVDRQDSELAGICTKCNFCAPRVEAGRERGYQPGIDREATPMCVVTCTANALHFGDLDDVQSNVSRLIRRNKTAHLQEALGTHPVVTYIVE